LRETDGELAKRRELPRDRALDEPLRPLPVGPAADVEDGPLGRGHRDAVDVADVVLRQERRAVLPRHFVATGRTPKLGDLDAPLQVSGYAPQGRCRPA